MPHVGRRIENAVKDKSECGANCAHSAEQNRKQNEALWTLAGGLYEIPASRREEGISESESLLRANPEKGPGEESRTCACQRERQRRPRRKTPALER